MISLSLSLVVWISMISLSPSLVGYDFNVAMSLLG